MSGPSELPVSEVFLDAEFAEARQLQVAGYQVVVYSHRSPDRTTSSEDACACFQADASTAVLMVADGVGGHQSGEVAAAQAVECIRSQLERQERTSLREMILDGIEAANTAVLKRGLGAATTLALVTMRQGIVRPYHVGDSLITLLSQRGRIKWQSVGHAPVGYAVEAGLLDEEEAMLHPERHLVSNVVGDEEMSISLGPSLEMAPRDTLVICSDGLSDNVSTDEMAEILRTGPLRDACDDLVQLARSRMQAANGMQDGPGKPDDLTVVACRTATEPAATDAAAGSSPKQPSAD